MKKQTKRTVLWSILAVVAVIIIILAVYIADLTAFPGSVQEKGYDKQVSISGVKSTFHQGVVYRYPGMVPLLDVTGDYYEMGLQYGVLLKPEITGAIVSFTRILKWNADEMGVPYPILVGLVKFQSGQMAKTLPDRYVEEMKGVAEGSGTPLETIQAISLFYDVSQAMGCTGVLMKGKDGIILHGTNQDTSSFGGEEMGKLTVVVRRNTPGHNSVTNMDQPLYLGLSTGFNDKGIVLFENSLHVRQSNPDGFPVLYLLRMALEDCSNISQVEALLDEYHIIGASSVMWSSRDERNGLITEILPKTWSATRLDSSVLWLFNRILNTELTRYQTASPVLTGHNYDREAVASTFPRKAEYTIEDEISFLRLVTGPDGTDYSWCGTRWPICNWSGQRIILYDPNGDGFYLGTGIYYAAMQNIYHVHSDFSQPPALFMKSVPLNPLVEEVAKIENKLVSRQEKLRDFVGLAKQYKDDANIHFLVAYDSFIQARWDLFADYARKAYTMKPSIIEYQLFAGLAAYQQKDPDSAVSLLQGIDTEKLSQVQRIYRLEVLQRAWEIKDTQKAAQCKAEIAAILNKYNAQAYYKENILPKMEALNSSK